MGGRVFVKSSLGNGSTFAVSAYFRLPREGEETDAMYDPLGLGHMSKIEEMIPDSSVAVTSGKSKKRALKASGSSKTHSSKRRKKRGSSKAVAKSGAGQTVLVVEDNSINQKVAKLLLQNHGFAVEVACNGMEAVEIVAKSPGGFDFILMDVFMPIMDGHKATQCIRGLNWTKPIIGLTANATAKDKQQCLASGMDTIVTKPFLIANLLAVMKQLRELSADSRELGRKQALAESEVIKNSPVMAIRSHIGATSQESSTCSSSETNSPRFMATAKTYLNASGLSKPQASGLTKIQAQTSVSSVSPSMRYRPSLRSSAAAAPIVLPASTLSSSPSSSSSSPSSESSHLILAERKK